METWSFSRRSLTVSQIGLGGAALSGAYGDRDDDNAGRVLAAAVDLGITYFDTSDAYGNGHNEELFGRHLSALGDRVVIGTKFGNIRGPNGERGGTNAKPDYVPVAVERSLERLKREVIDLYMLHRVDPEVAIEETVGAMAGLVEAGKVRHLGLCEASAATIRRAHAVHPLTFVQTEYSLWTRDVEGDILPTCRELGVALMAYAPLGRGFLSAKIHSQADLTPKDRRKDHPRFFPENLEQNVGLLGTLEAVATRHQCKPAQVALAWLDASGSDILPIPATTRIEHLEENVAACRVKLSDDDVAELNTAFKPGIAAGTRYPEKQMHLMSADSRPLGL